MSAVWAARPDTVCIHPLGPRIVGPSEIAASWALIFTGGAPHRVDIKIIAKWQNENFAIHHVDELIAANPADTQHRPVIATNIYERISNGWYLTAHHASLDARSDMIESRATPLNPTRH